MSEEEWRTAVGGEILFCFNLIVLVLVSLLQTYNDLSDKILDLYLIAQMAQN